MKVVNWNVLGNASSRRDEILTRERRLQMLSESDLGLLAGMPGHTIHSRPDGVKGIGNLRKVLLWSREPWENVDGGIDSMPPGRFVSGVTRTPLGACCIPYRDARVDERRCSARALGGPQAVSGQSAKVVGATRRNE